MNNRKRNNQREAKKWRDHEVEDILNYMQVHRNLEKPSARIYYSKLIAETNLDATWSLVRHKVRHLKIGWQKAEAFVKSTEGREVINIRAKLLKMCPHYEQLVDIYKGNKEMELVVLESDGPQWSRNMAHCEEESLMDAMLMEDSSDVSDSEASFVNKAKREEQNSSLAQLASMEEFQDKRLLLETESLQLKNEQFLWSKEQRKLVIEEKKQTLKELRIKSEFKLKQEEIESRERMHKLELEFQLKQEEIESRERMHKLELEFNLKQEQVESREKMHKLELEFKYSNND